MEGERSLAKSVRVPGHSLSRVTLSVKASDPPPRRMRIATKVTTVGVVADGLVLLPSKYTAGHEPEIVKTELGSTKMAVPYVKLYEFSIFGIFEII